MNIYLPGYCVPGNIKMDTLPPTCPWDGHISRICRFVAGFWARFKKIHWVGILQGYVRQLVQRGDKLSPRWHPVPAHAMTFIPKPSLRTEKLEIKETVLCHSLFLIYPASRDVPVISFQRKKGGARPSLHPLTAEVSQDGYRVPKVYCALLCYW